MTYLYRAALGLLIAAAVLPGTRTRADDMPVIEMTLNDGVITPQHVEIAAGKPFKLVVRNVGTTAAEFESKRLYEEKVLAPGAEAVLEFKKLSPGTYPFFDEFRMNLDSANGTITAK